MKKREIKATRPMSYGQWHANIGKKMLRACEGDVSALFSGVARASECIFEVTTRRPRTPDYHRFDWNGASYHTTEETTGSYCLMSETAYKLRNAMGRANTIYVAVYTED